MGFCSSLCLGLGKEALGAHPAVAVVGNGGASPGAGVPRVSHPGLSCVIQAWSLGISSDSTYPPGQVPPSPL